MGPALPASQGPRTWDGGQVPREGRPDTRWSGQAPPREPRGRSRFRPADCIRTEEITLDTVNLIQGGLVLYLAAEGSHGLCRRAIGWRRTKGKQLPKPRFKLIPHAIALTGDDFAPLVSAILALEERPVLIIIDTLARTFGAGDENRQADMNAYVGAADRIREATGANVM